MIGLGQSMLDVVGEADAVEDVRAELSLPLDDG
jgi:hypothetical protein